LYFDSVAAAISMDGHGAFVWSAYFITSVAVAFMMISPRIKERRLLRQLAGDIRRQQGRPDSSAGEK
jgi:heme exporter protein D